MLQATRHTYKIADTDLIVSHDRRYVLRVRDMPSEEKPREKLAASSPDNLSVAELIAIIWGVGTKKEDVLAMARRIVKEYGEKSLLSQTNPHQLADTLQIPYAKSCQIIASLELGRRFYATRAGRPIFVHSAIQAFDHVKSIAASRKEILRGLYLNSRYQIIHDEVISIGSLTANVIHPREVFQPAIEHSAVAVILAHNHPSGSLKPSDADVAVTRQLIEAGNLLGIDLLDHIIVCDKKYVSIKESVL